MGPGVIVPPAPFLTALRTGNDFIGLLPIPRHIHKGVLIRRIIASHLCTAVGGQQFCKQLRKLQTRIILERYFSLFHYYLLSSPYVMLQKSILRNPKWEGTASLLPPPPPPRSDGIGQE